VVTNWYSDYKDFEGVLLPQSITTRSTATGESSFLFYKIELNIAVDENVV
jgi:hypothetical protein